MTDQLQSILNLIDMAHHDLTTETAALDWNHPLARIRFDLFQVSGALEEYIKEGRRHDRSIAG